MSTPPTSLPSTPLPPLTPLQLPLDSLAPDPSYIDPLIALAPTPSNLSTLALSLLNPRPSSVIDLQSVTQVFTSAYLRAASSGDSDLIEWLLAKPESPYHLTSLPRHAPRHSHQPDPSSSSTVSLISSPNLLHPGQPRSYVNVDTTDEDGTPPIILAAAFGHPEAVRAIVDGIGGDVVDSRDAVGWTALHWAARNGDFTIASYLLNHGASTNIVSYSEQSSSNGRPTSPSARSGLSTSSSSTLTSESTPFASLSADDALPSIPTSFRPKRPCRSRGLRPFDLAKRGPDGDNIRHIIHMAEEAKAESSACPSRPSSRTSMASVRTAARNAQSSAAQSEAQRLLDLGLLCARTLGLDFTLLGVHVDPSLLTLKSYEYDHIHDSAEIHPSPHDIWEREQRAEVFDWEHCLPHQMLVCSMDDLPILFDAAITLLDPQRSRHARFVPANVVFLSARFAAHFGTDDLLEELLLGTVDRIEEVVLARQDNMANSAFWLFNSLALLYYLQRDPHLNSTTTDCQIHFHDLINEIFVFIIRDAERRLDKVLDSAMLDFQPLPGFDDVEFEPEGSWRFVKALTVKRNRTTSVRPSIGSFLSNTAGALSPPPTLPSSSSKINNSSRTRASTHNATSAMSTSLSNHSSTTKSPRTITDLLSSVLYLLQAYEIHPSVIVQAFSQIFYWLACEMFNRIITRRKYLCRSKAMQIRLNVNILEDWARTNRIPSRVVEHYFQPLNHLLQWLQCLSHNQAFDALIETMTDLRALNPVQMLKASRDYRFEVEEPKMSEECRQYLVQMQQDWDRRRLQKKEDLEERERAEREMLEASHLNSPSASALAVEAKTERAAQEAVEAIDAAFMDPNLYESYQPPSAPECLGELLDSRYMLPFGLPTATESLVNMRSEVPFGPFKSFEQPVRPPSSLDQTNKEDEPTGDTADPTDNFTCLSASVQGPAPCETNREVVPILPDGILSRLDAVRDHHRKVASHAT